jgi:capsular polysaccharide biosynthesis protein
MEVAQCYCTVAPQVISDLNANTTLKVADEPEMPTSPVYPHAGRAAIIAALIGAVLMIIVAFVRHFLDKNIRYNDEMTEIYGIPILAAIPNFDRYLGQKSTAQKYAATKTNESKTS